MAIDQIKLNDITYDIGIRANKVSFDNNKTNLEATDSQSAIVEINNKFNNYYTSGELDIAFGTKQDSLSFDNVPIKNSNNLVKSGGVFSVVGDLSKLETSTKVDLVSAINELKQLIDTL